LSQPDLAGFIVRRVLLGACVLLTATVVLFLAVVVLPGDPVQGLSGRAVVSPAIHHAISARFGLDEPVWRQYLSWLGGLVTGDLGESFRTRRAVSDVLAETLPVSLALAGLATIFELVIGLGLGLTLAAGRRTIGVVAAALLVVFLLAVPAFALAATTQDLLALRWHVIPVTASGSLSSLILPALILGAAPAGVLAVVTRDTVRQTMTKPHVVAARAKGISARRVLASHVLRPSSGPILALVGANVGALIVGAVVVEGVFDIDGAGEAVFRAIRGHDNAAILGFSVVLVALYVVVSTAVDVVAAALDPRLRMRDA
jgi:ABC-type dipeptide/oligopeptide/nickel transport system permease component